MAVEALPERLCNRSGRAAADRAIEGSQAQEENGFKIELARNTLRRTLAEVTATIERRAR